MDIQARQSLKEQFIFTMLDCFFTETNSQTHDYQTIQFTAISELLAKIIKYHQSLTPQASIDIVAKNIIHLVNQTDDTITASHFRQQAQTVQRAINQQQKQLRRIPSQQSQIMQLLGDEYLRRIVELEKDTPLPRKRNHPNPYFIKQIYALVYRHLQHELHNKHTAEILGIMGVYCSEQTIEKTLAPSIRNGIHAKINRELRDEKEQLSRLAQFQAANTPAQTPPPELSDLEKLIQIKSLLQSIHSDECTAIAQETFSALAESLNAYGVKLPE